MAAGGACPKQPSLPGPALIRTAELASPRSMMRLPTWSRASKEGVEAAHAMDLTSGSLHGQKRCTSWRERLQQIKVEDVGIARLTEGSNERLSGEECQRLCERMRAVLQKEPNVVRVRAPVAIAGNVHGQFLDLLNLLAVCGPVPETSYLFLGSYVNRGYDSVSTLCLLFYLKIRYPQRITLLRGNQESSQISQVYSFYDECMQRYGHSGPSIWRAFCDCFNVLPLAATLEGEVLCLHAGLSPSIDTLDQIEELNRCVEVPSEGPMCDLLWTDPDERMGWGMFGRSLSYTFGEDVTKQFLQLNGLSSLTRGHQLHMDGFGYVHDEQVLTVWSAPNYCNRCGNRAAALQVDESMRRSIAQFDAAPWPSRTSL